MGNSEICDIIHQCCIYHQLAQLDSRSQLIAVVIGLNIRQTCVTSYLPTLLATLYRFHSVLSEKDFYQDTYSRFLFVHGILTRKQMLALS